MTDGLKALLKAARQAPISSDERERQRRSFAYGNTAIENPLITRDMVDREADELARDNPDGGQD